MLGETVFSNANLKQSKLQEHFDNRYREASVVGHDEKSFRAERVRFDSRATLPKLGFVFVDKPPLMASYQQLVPLSNNVIQSRIVHLSLDILKHVISHMKASPGVGNLFSTADRFQRGIILRTDPKKNNEFLAHGNLLQLLGHQHIALVRYVHDDTIKENFLFYE